MMTRDQIKNLFLKLNEMLVEKGTRAEIGVVGGAVMCLVYNARASTQDVDAIFEPSSLVRDLARKLAESENISSDWLNDGVKGFVRDGFKRIPFLELSHLSIWTPEPKYMLAMKCISARWDTSDKDDVKTLIGVLKIANKEEVFQIIEEFYPKNQISAKTQFFIEELLN